MGSKFLPLLLALIPMFGWGANAVLIAKLSRLAGGLKSGLFIQASALAISLLFLPIFFSPPRAIDWLLVLFAGGSGALTYYLYCRCLKEGSVPIVVPIVSAWALVSFVLGIIFLKESLTTLKIVGTGLTILGIIFLSINWRGIKSLKTIISAGVLTALVVALGMGVNSFIMGLISRQTGWFFGSFLMRVSMVLFLLSLYLFKQPNINKKLVSPISWKLLLPAAILEFVAFTAYNLAVSKYEISYVSVISSASPLITVIFARFFLYEKTSLIQKVGTFFTVCGIISLNI
jgi:drug/metabolite transporter (DMT)-like permease